MAVNSLQRIISFYHESQVRKSTSSLSLRLTTPRSKTLSVTADLKATQISQDIGLYRDLAQAVSTRNSVQALLQKYDDGNDTEVLLIDLEVTSTLPLKSLLTCLQSTLRAALAGGIDDTLLLQAAIFPRNDQLDPNRGAIANATGEDAQGKVALPYKYDNGSQVYLGDAGLGYPRELYPNFTWTEENNDTMRVSYENRTLNYDSTLVIGPLYLDDQSALLSMTVAINNNTSRTDVLGWLTVVVDARLFYDIVSDPIGMGRTGEVLIVGPVSPNNLFRPSNEQKVASDSSDVNVWFVLPPNSNKTVGHRHDLRAAHPDLPFPIDDYPAVAQAFSEPTAGSHLSTNNEEGKTVSVGYVRVQSNLVNWVVIFEESRGEVMSPINRLRNTMLACIFSVFGVIILVCFPIAHYAVKPIRLLRNATEKSIMTYEAEVPDSSSGGSTDPESLKHAEYVTSNGILPEKLRQHKKPKMQRRREFKIPEKVPDRRHLLEDELTDLTCTYNEMSDELRVQYARLEDRVKKRTSELEKSRDLARAADESKTLFIANVSHELRTPLNGIIGMCSVAMQEDELHRIRQSLNIIYKSSDLLLHLLNDLLTFSRNSFGQQLSIEHGIFRLGDVGTQLVSIFEKQAREKDVGVKVVFQGVSSDTKPEFDDAPEDVIHARQDIGRMLKRVKSSVLARGPADTGPLRDMALLGDKNRILQVLMNLVSNSLKFTPAGGMIEVRIRCKGFAAATSEQTDIGSENKAVESSESGEKAPIAAVTPTPPPRPTRQLKFDFEVEDTGPGIPEHLRQEIFKPFVQGDLALSRKHGGTGLGLAICAQLASLMGGSIHLKSTVDIGSTFTCSIPLGFTKERVPSIAGSLASSSRHGSLKPPSLTSSIDVLSTQSMRPPTRGTTNNTQPQFAKGSVRSGYLDDSPKVDNSRILSFTQPFVADNRDSDEEESKKPAATQPRPSRQLSAAKARLQSIASKDESCDPSHAPPDDNNTQQPDNCKQKENGIATEDTIPPGSPAAKPQPQPQPQKPKIKILVAEDNKVNQQVILRMLKLEKITDVAVAEDGVQAVEQVRTSLDPSSDSAFCFIFMDIQMPNMDGIEATKEIRKLGFEASIVALTAFDHETNREACSNAGMNDFVGKPLKRRALRDVLEKFLGKEGVKEKSELRMGNTA